MRVLLDLEDDITVVGEATTGAEAVERARATRPDVILMDIRMPQLDGIEATCEIANAPGLNEVHVLILTTYDTDAYVFEALEAGASVAGALPVRTGQGAVWCGPHGGRHPVVHQVRVVTRRVGSTCR